MVATVTPQARVVFVLVLVAWLGALFLALVLVRSLVPDVPLPP